VDPFQNHYFSENLVTSGIDPGSSGSVAGRLVFLDVIIIIGFGENSK
jgi:hypothetical protein